MKRLMCSLPFFLTPFCTPALPAEPEEQGTIVSLGDGVDLDLGPLDRLGKRFAEISNKYGNHFDAYRSRQLAAFSSSLRSVRVVVDQLKAKNNEKIEQEKKIQQVKREISGDDALLERVNSRIEHEAARLQAESDRYGAAKDYYNKYLAREYSLPNEQAAFDAAGREKTRLLKWLADLEDEAAQFKRSPDVIQAQTIKDRKAARDVALNAAEAMRAINVRELQEFRTSYDRSLQAATQALEMLLLPREHAAGPKTITLGPAFAQLLEENDSAYRAKNAATDEGQAAGSTTGFDDQPDRSIQVSPVQMQSEVPPELRSEYDSTSASLEALRQEQGSLHATAQEIMHHPAAHSTAELNEVLKREASVDSQCVWKAYQLKLLKNAAKIR